MIVSMTGFGSSRGSGTDVEVEVTVKALNGRFLEVRCHLPREYSGFERDIKSQVGAQLHRGTIDVYIMRRPRGTQPAELAVNVGAAKAWVKSYRQLGKSLGLKGDPTLAQLMEVPEILNWQPARAEAAEKDVLFKTLKKSIALCVTEREREGRALGRHLEKLLAQLQKEVGKIERLADEARLELGKRLEARLERSPFAEKIDAQRLNQELAVYLERADIAEEVHRLKEHLKICDGLFRSESRPGKKLDFYCQELHREVNTVGSKAHLPQLTQLVVESKSLVEQLKEQVQNIL
jgi:uncharacterized protein (TIGR00255 family)